MTPNVRIHRTARLFAQVRWNEWLELGCNDDPACPRHFGDTKVAALLKRSNKVSDLFGVPFWPIGLGQHVVNDIQPRGTDKRQRFFKEAIFPRPSVGKDKVKMLAIK